MPLISNISSHTQTTHSIQFSLISRISLSHTYYLTQCNSHSPQSAFVIQSSRSLTLCLAHLLIHPLTRNLVKLHLLGFWPLNCFQCRLQLVFLPVLKLRLSRWHEIRDGAAVKFISRPLWLSGFDLRQTVWGQRWYNQFSDFIVTAAASLTGHAALCKWQAGG